MPDWPHENGRSAKSAQELFIKTLARWPIGDRDPTLILVTHALPDNEIFARFLASVFKKLIVIPKPRSRDERAIRAMSKYGTIAGWSRADLQTPAGARAVLASLEGSGRVVIADMGGYLAASTGALASALGRRFAGVVEDTVNGHVRYVATKALCPVVSVARVAAKEPEDILVGRAIARSVHDALAAVGKDVRAVEHVVLGFGCLGRSTAIALAEAGGQVSVFDTDPLKRLSAKAAGFSTPSRGAAISRARILVSATGCKGLATRDLDALRNGCIVASVTSADDELDFAGVSRAWASTDGPGGLTIMRRLRDGKEVRLINGGNAANFLFGAVVGPPIHLMHAVILMALARLLAGDVSGDGIVEPALEDQRTLAALWWEAFRSDEDAVDLQQ